MSITSQAEIELVTQVLEDDPVPDYLEHQAAVVEKLGMEVDSARQQLATLSQQLEVLMERMSYEEDMLVGLCERARHRRSRGPSSRASEFRSRARSRHAEPINTHVGASQRR